MNKLSFEVEETYSEFRRNQIVNFCNKLINDDFTLQDIKDNIDDLYSVTLWLLPDIEGKVYASVRVAILKDDIMEMDSISEEEKNQEIMDLVTRNKQELQELAAQIIIALEKDLERYEKDLAEYKEEAKRRGYCTNLLENEDVIKNEE